MGRPARSEEQLEAARARIRSVAIGLYREGGIEAISMRAVAAAAGMSPGALYAYYPNRMALLQSLWSAPVSQAIVEMRETAAEVADPLLRIERILAGYIKLACDNPEIYRGAFLFVRPARMPPPEAAALETLEFHVLLREAIKEGQAAERLRPCDPDLAAQILWAGLHGALALPNHMEMFRFAPPRALVEEMSRALLRSLVAG